MPNKIFSTLLERQINQFIETYQKDSNIIFKDFNNTLIHPGEYGMYREQCFKNLLRMVLPREYDILEGFIISSSEKYSVTTQCDILIKNAFSIPLSNGNLGKFYPAEDIYGIIEIKSDLDNAQLEEALRKMATVKRISDYRKNKKVVFSSAFSYDTIPSFLVCNKLKTGKQPIDFDKIYAGFERKYWHNAILSVENGVSAYLFKVNELPHKVKELFTTIFNPNGGCCFPFPQIIYQNQLCNFKKLNFSENSQNKYEYIEQFLEMIIQAVQIACKYEFDGIEYLGIESKSLVKHEPEGLTTENNPIPYPHIKPSQL